MVATTFPQSQYSYAMFGFGKFERKCEGKKMKRKNGRKEKKNILKINKLFLYIYSNLFHLVSSII